MYDNTKFYAAFDQWLVQNVTVGFGEHYAGELLEDFNEFVEETQLMKRTPGRVVFGRRMKERGFESRKSGGLTYWSGLKLNKPRIVQPKRYAKTLEQTKKEIERREAIIEKRMYEKSPVARDEQLLDFRLELEEEERKLRALEDEPIEP